MSNKEKINIAALLKDCPRGMELDCTIYDGVTLDSVVFESDCHYDGKNNYPIKIVTKSGFSTRLTKYGQNVDIDEAKCMIFPKGKTTWEGFHRPFKDGDIVFICEEYADADFTYVAIFKEMQKDDIIVYCSYEYDDNMFFPENSSYDGYKARLATEEEKQKLFGAIKDNGYKWNDETKTLGELIEPKFKNGDILFVDTNDEGDDDDCFKYTFILKEMDGRRVIAYCYITGEDYFKSRKVYLTDNTHPIRFATEDEKTKLFDAIKEDGLKWNAETKTLEELIVPKFKVGDRIQYNKEYECPTRIIKSLKYDRYILDNGHYVKFGNEGAYKLLKFDINTLKTFDKVLVRLTNDCIWTPKFFFYYDNSPKVKYYPFVTTDNIGYPQCIPYEGNEHLCRKTDNCDEFYKNW